MHSHQNLSHVKRPFFLLEVLFALCLLALCLTPLLRIPSLAIKKQRDAIAHMEEKRLARLAFAEAKAILYNNSLSWNEIENGYTLPLQSMKGTWQLERVKEIFLPNGEQIKRLTICVSLQNSKRNKKMQQILIAAQR